MFSIHVTVSFNAGVFMFMLDNQFKDCKRFFKEAHDWNFCFGPIHLEWFSNK